MVDACPYFRTIATCSMGPGGTYGGASLLNALVNTFGALKRRHSRKADFPLRAIGHQALTQVLYAATRISETN